MPMYTKETKNVYEFIQIVSAWFTDLQAYAPHAYIHILVLEPLLPDHSLIDLRIYPSAFSVYLVKKLDRWMHQLNGKRGERYSVAPTVHQTLTLRISFLPHLDQETKDSNACTADSTSLETKLRRYFIKLEEYYSGMRSHELHNNFSRFVTHEL